MNQYTKSPFGLVSELYYRIEFFEEDFAKRVLEDITRANERNRIPTASSSWKSFALFCTLSLYRSERSLADLSWDATTT